MGSLGRRETKLRHLSQDVKPPEVEKKATSLYLGRLVLLKRGWEMEEAAFVKINGSRSSASIPLGTYGNTALLDMF